jgi:methyl-accepting chemotaxis protein WspA
MATLWQRLNVAILLVIILVLGAFGLTLWVTEVRSAALVRSELLSSARDRIAYDVVQVSDSVRGLLLDPKDEAEKGRKREAEAELTASLASIQAAFPTRAGLSNAVEHLRTFASRTLSEFNRKVLTTADSDPNSAMQLHNRDYPEIRSQRAKLFADLRREITQVQNEEAHRAWQLASLALVPFVLILLGIPILHRLHRAAVTEPLNRLVAKLERMRQGDFTERLALEQQDGFGILGDGLNRLADELSALVGQVQRSGNQVNTTARQIAATAKQQHGTANEIAATTTEIGATSKQISTTSKELVKTMNELNQVAAQTTELAGSGQALIARMEATMRRIMDASGSITAKLAVLSEKTTNINSVVTTITKVADQTNLLSLNAAIEAEKAGEYGLGFAVVAMEIRRLADQTGVATYDIEKMVKEMQSSVAAGVMGMDKFGEEARRGVEEIHQVSTHLAQIIHQVQALTPRFQAVNDGMHAQAHGAEQISETLTQLSEAARNTAESLQQSNAAIGQLNEAAQGLQSSIARFKLEK